MNVPEVLFCPDNYLGKWVEEQLGNINVITYDGCCPIHRQIVPEDVVNARRIYENAKVLVHPECDKEVCKLADFVGSTKQIMDYVEQNDDKTFVIATEKGVVDRLQRDYPQKEFILIREDIVCKSMKYNTLEDIYDVLKNETNEIFIDEIISKRALGCINRMLEVCK